MGEHHCNLASLAEKLLAQTGVVTAVTVGHIVVGILVHEINPAEHLGVVVELDIREDLQDVLPVQYKILWIEVACSVQPHGKTSALLFRKSLALADFVDEDLHEQLAVLEEQAGFPDSRLLDEVATRQDVNLVVAASVQAEPLAELVVRTHVVS